MKSAKCQINVVIVIFFTFNSSLNKSPLSSESNSSFLRLVNFFNVPLSLVSKGACSLSLFAFSKALIKGTLQNEEENISYPIFKK